jgi:hypothetical protein
VPQSHKLIWHIDLASYHKHTAGLKRSLAVTTNIAETCHEARESCCVDGADAKDGVDGQIVVEDGVCQERCGFDCVWEVAAEFPGHDAGDCLVAEVGVAILVLVLILVLGWSGLDVEGVELLADGEEVGVCAPGSYGVA